MKTKFLFTLSLILVSLYTFAQPVSEPFKKANTILVETKLQSDEAFIKWGRHLAQNGFSIESSDKDFLSLTTGTKNVGHQQEYVVLSSVNNDGTIIIKMKWKKKIGANRFISESDFTDWYYTKNKNFIWYQLHQSIMETINSFGDYDVYYEKQ